MSKLVIPGVIASAGGSGGGGGTVDQTYDPTSTNAQSGTAVAEAVAPKIQNESTYSGAVCIGGYDKTVSTHKGNAGSILIGENAYSDANSSSAAVVIGKNSAGGAYAVTLGTNAGSNSYEKSNATIVGAKAEATTNSVSIGAFSRSIGTITNAITIGGGTSASNCAKSSANGAIQLGIGNNSTANSFQVFTFQMLDGTTGKIPEARLPGRKMYRVSGFSADNYILLSYIPTGTVSNYEIEVVAQYASTDHTYSGLLGNASGNYNIPQILANNSSLNLNFNHPAADGQWAPQSPTVSISNGGIYHAYFIWDGTTIYGTTGLGYSGIHTGIQNESSNTIYWNSQIAVGVDYASSLSSMGNAWEGWIDLATLKIRVNGDLVFDGSTAKAGTDFTIVGNPTIVEA